MTEHYFVGGSLPDVEVGLEPEISFVEFARLLRLNLKPDDLAKSRVMRIYWDFENIRTLWKGGEIEKRGNYDENELQEAIATKVGLPSYFYEFYERYDTDEERLKEYPKLLIRYFTEEGEKATGFLKEWLIFERGYRLALLGFRAKKLGRDLAQELQFENPEDDIVVEMMAQKDAKTYEPPSRFEGLKALFEEHFEEPLELEMNLCRWRSDEYDRFGGIDLFSIDKILAYQAKLVMAERWMELDRKKGKQALEGIEERL